MAHTTPTAHNPSYAEGYDTTTTGKVIIILLAITALIGVIVWKWWEVPIAPGIVGVSVVPGISIGKPIDLQVTIQPGKEALVDVPAGYEFSWNLTNTSYNEIVFRGIRDGRPAETLTKFLFINGRWHVSHKGARPELMNSTNQAIQMARGEKLLVSASPGRAEVMTFKFTPS